MPYKPLILVVDDEPLMRRAIRRLLDKVFQVVEAGDAFETLRCLDDGCPAEAVVAEFHVPGLPGDVLVSRIVEAHPDLPVLITCPNLQPHEIERVMQAGATEVLDKVSLGETLVATLRPLVGRRGGGRRRAAAGGEADPEADVPCARFLALRRPDDSQAA